MLIIPFLAHRSISSGLLVFKSAAKTIAFKTKDNLCRIFRKLMAFYYLGKEQSSVAIKHLLPLNTLDIQLLFKTITNIFTVYLRQKRSRFIKSKLGVY